MSPGDERLLRWYPPAWRARYGDEMHALLQDTYAVAGRIPWRARLGLVRGGLEERAREAGVVGPAGGPAGRVRGGSLLVLCAFALFLVGGGMLAKFTDEWRSGTPGADLTLLNAALHVVLAAATVAGVLVLVAAALVAPAFVRLVRARRWPEVRAPFLFAVVAGALAAVLLGSLVVWSRGLSAHDRNGGLAGYSLLFLAMCAAVVVALALGTAAAVAVARRVDLASQTIRALGRLAVGVSVALVLMFGGVVTWWAGEAASSPAVMADGIGNGVVYASDTVPPTLLAAGSLMVLGLVLATAGSVRVLRAARPSRHRPATG